MPAVQNTKQVNRELQRLGFGHLKDSNLMAQMAFLVRDHDHFRHILMHMSVPDRNDAYKCLAPRLRFKAKPLEDYEILSKQEAEKLQLPEYNPKTLEAREWGSRNVETPEYKGVIQSKAGKKIPDATVEFHVPAERSVLTATAEESIDRSLREAQARYQLTLTCKQCTFTQNIRVKNKPAAYKVAKEYGWTIQGDKALCFACTKKRAN